MLGGKHPSFLKKNKPKRKTPNKSTKNHHVYFIRLLFLTGGNPQRGTLHISRIGQEDETRVAEDHEGGRSCRGREEHHKASTFSYKGPSFFLEIQNTPKKYESCVLCKVLQTLPFGFQKIKIYLATSAVGLYTTL